MREPGLIHVSDLLVGNFQLSVLYSEGMFINNRDVLKSLWNHLGISRDLSTLNWLAFKKMFAPVRNSLLFIFEYGSERFEMSCSPFLLSKCFTVPKNNC